MVVRDPVSVTVLDQMMGRSGPRVSDSFGPNVGSFGTPREKVEKGGEKMQENVGKG